MCTQAVSLPQALQTPCQAELALLTMVREASFRARAAFTPLLIFSYMQREPVKLLTCTCRFEEHPPAGRSPTYGPRTEVSGSGPKAVCVLQHFTPQT